MKEDCMKEDGMKKNGIKKVWLMFVSAITLLMITTTPGSAAENFSEGKQYQKLDRPAAAEQQVIEFFSFYCPHCYQFDKIYGVSQAVEKILPPGVKMTRYHVQFLGLFGKELTQAWAVATVLGIEDKISPLIFEAVQKTETIKSPDDIRNIFIKTGVSGTEYDAALNSFVVKSLVSQQVKTAENFKLRGVPAMFVNGNYMIINEGMETELMDDYAKRYADVVSFLINKK